MVRAQSRLVVVADARSVAGDDALLALMRTRTRINGVALTDSLANDRAAGLTLTSPMRVVSL
jgi:hypothetical protein